MITLGILFIVLIVLWIIGILSINLSKRFKKYLNSFHDKLWKAKKRYVDKDIATADAEYGCIGFEGEEYKVLGKIIPIEGFINVYVDPRYKSRTLSYNESKNGVQQALNLIEQYMGKVRFKIVNSRADAQVAIGFHYSGTSGMPRQRKNFNTNTLAFAFLGNNTDAKGIIGDIFFNEKYNWAIGIKSGYIDFVRVFAHELLHSLGLFHQTHTRNGILYPSYHTGPILVTVDTQDGLKFLYGNLAGPDGIEPPKDEEPDVPEEPKEPDCPPCPECPEPEPCPECPDAPEPDGITEAAITTFFNPKSQNAMNPFLISDPDEVDRYDKLKHVKSGVIMTVVYVGQYRGDTIHIVQREKPWTNRLDISKGDKLEIIKT